MLVFCNFRRLTFFFKNNYTVPVTSVVLTSTSVTVALTSTSVTVTAGRKMDLNCTTSLCDPQANITWYKESKNITNNSTYLTFKEDSLVKTTSELQILVSKKDNGQHIYCAASNIPGRSINSTVHTLVVLCKF